MPFAMSIPPKIDLLGKTGAPVARNDFCPSYTRDEVKRGKLAHYRELREAAEYAQRIQAARVSLGLVNEPVKLVAADYIHPDDLRPRVIARRDRFRALRDDERETHCHVERNVQSIPKRPLPPPAAPVTQKFAKTTPPLRNLESLKPWIDSTWATDYDEMAERVRVIQARRQANMLKVSK